MSRQQRRDDLKVQVAVLSWASLAFCASCAPADKQRSSFSTLGQFAEWPAGNRMLKFDHGHKAPAKQIISSFTQSGSHDFSEIRNASSDCPPHRVANPFPGEGAACITVEKANKFLSEELKSLAKKGNEDYTLDRLIAWSGPAKLDQTYDGMTPLMRAASLGLVKAVKKLTDLGASATVTTDTDCSATDYAIVGVGSSATEADSKPFQLIARFLTCDKSLKPPKGCSQMCALITGCQFRKIGSTKIDFEVPSRSKCDEEEEKPPQPAPSSAIRPLAPRQFALLAASCSAVVALRSAAAAAAV